MSKFNTTTTPAKNVATSPVKSTGEVTLNAQREAGVARDLKSEIFLLAVSNFVGEDTFYESAKSRDARFAKLSQRVVLEDFDWTLRFTRWLRSEANMRSVALVLALEGAKALNEAHRPGGRQLVDAALLRADEPGEALAYWFKEYGRKLPKSVKRGVADASVRLYSEYSVGKYDTASKGFRFGDVIDLTHPTPVDARQSELFKFVLDRRRDSSTAPGPQLSLLKARAEVLALSPQEKRDLLTRGTLGTRLEAAGLAWETLAGSLAGGMDAAAWEAVIPSMGYMALLRNLRNFDEAGISSEVRQQVADRLTNAKAVAKSRQLPFRFMSAYFAAPSDYWKPVLNTALALSLKNIPALQGDTEIMIDTSGSMTIQLSERGTVTCAQQASLFGIAFAVVNKLDRVWGFDSTLKEFKIKRGADILSEVQRFQKLVTGGATLTASCADELLARRKLEGKGDLARLIVISDEQIGESARIYPLWGANSYNVPALPTVIPAKTMLYTFNIGGYRIGHTESGMPNRHTFTGMNDSAFKMIALIERGRSADWPF